MRHLLSVSHPSSRAESSILSSPRQSICHRPSLVICRGHKEIIHNISYSTRKDVVHGRDLAALFSVTKPVMVEDITGENHHFRYWKEGFTDPHQIQKLDLALANSFVIASAFTAEDVYRTSLEKEGFSTDRSRSLLPWPMGGSKPGHLVGVARAIGDANLVATICEIAVHPAVQHHGVARRLLRLLIQQITSFGIYDIGTPTPPSAMPFFAACEFELDREVSSFMRFQPNELEEETLTADSRRLVATTRLEPILLAKLDKASIQRRPIMLPLLRR